MLALFVVLCAVAGVLMAAQEHAKKAQAHQGVRANIAEQDEAFAVYQSITGEDFESLGLDRDYLRSRVGQDHYEELILSWYPPPRTNTVVDDYLTRLWGKRTL